MVFQIIQALILLIIACAVGIILVRSSGKSTSSGVDGHSTPPPDNRGMFGQPLISSTRASFVDRSRNPEELSKPDDRVVTTVEEPGIRTGHSEEEKSQDGHISSRPHELRDASRSALKPAHSGQKSAWRGAFGSGSLSDTDSGSDRSEHRSDRSSELSNEDRVGYSEGSAEDDMTDNQILTKAEKPSDPSVNGSVSVKQSEAVSSGGTAKFDDLTKIRGIGPGYQRLLNQREIYRFSQIASWSNEDVSEFDKLLRFKGRIVRESWVEQANTLVQNRAVSIRGSEMSGETELKRKPDPASA